MTKIGFIGIACLIVVLYIGATTADGAFEDVELGARALGMGSAFVSVADGASAIFWNPAGIARTDRRELTMSYLGLYDLVSYSALGYTQQVGRGAIGSGIVSSSDVDGVYRETTIALSTAMEIYHGLSAGLNTKYLSSAANTGDIRIGSSKGLSLDLGCQYRALEDLLSAGAAFQNLMGNVWYDREAVGDISGRSYSEKPAFSYKVGAGFDFVRLLPRVDKALLAAELSDGDIHIGAECVFWNIIAARAGYRTGNALTRSITVGFGLGLSGFRLDYAYVGSAVGSQTSQFSVSVKW